MLTGFVIGVLVTLGAEAVAAVTWWIWLNSKSGDSTS